MCEQRDVQWQFDAFLNTLLILSLLVSTGARAGDLGVPHGSYKPEKDDSGLQIREIELFLDSGALTLSNVVLFIKITCYKGNKLVEIEIKY